MTRRARGVFRTYRPTPAHFHRHSDEHLYVLSGTGTVWLEVASKAKPFGPGTFVYFPRETVHAMPSLGEEPVVFLAIDTPRRHPEDIVFVDPAEGTAESFVQKVGERSPRVWPKNLYLLRAKTRFTLCNRRPGLAD